VNEVSWGGFEWARNRIRIGGQPKPKSRLRTVASVSFKKTYREALESEILPERDGSSDPCEPSQPNQTNQPTRRPYSTFSLAMNATEKSERGQLHLPSADDDYARRFVRFRSERVTVSVRDCFGGGCHDYAAVTGLPLSEKECTPPSYVIVGRRGKKKLFTRIGPHPSFPQEGSPIRPCKYIWRAACHDVPLTDLC
jgi:hypothetical protein